MEYVTVNTDASFSHQGNAGGYAFYIKCNLFKIQKSGILKNPKNSYEAELMAIGNALHTLLKKNFKTDTIVINTDCKGAINALTKNTVTSKSKKLVDRIRLMIFLLEERCKEVSLRHVKAHSGTGSARKWVNDWCDKEARKQMKLKLAKNDI